MFEQCVTKGLSQPVISAEIKLALLESSVNMMLIVHKLRVDVLKWPLRRNTVGLILNKQIITTLDLNKIIK